MNEITIFTCTIYPDLARLWYYFIQKNTKAPVIIYDCGVGLNKKNFPGALIKAHANSEHGKKIDHVAATVTTPLLMVIDDDAFILDSAILNTGIAKLNENKDNALLSYHLQDFFKLPVDGREYDPIGTYAFIFKPEIIKNLKLSFKSKKHQDPSFRIGSGYYDTGIFAQETLIRKNYNVLIDTSHHSKLPTLFGTSSGFLKYAKKKWFSDKYTSRYSASVLPKHIFENTETLQKACNIAIINSLYFSVFNEEPLFSDFPSLDKIQGIFDTNFSNASNAEQLKAMLDWKQEALKSLIEKL